MAAPSVVAPHNLELERSVLGAAFYAVDALHTLVGEDEAATLFYLDRHQAVLAAFTELAPSLNGTPPDVALVHAVAARHGEVDLGLLSSLYEAGVLVVDVRGYLRELRELAARREEHAIAVTIAAATRDDALERPALWTAVRQRLTAAEAWRARNTERAGAAAPVEAHALLAATFPSQPEIVGQGVLPRGAIGVVAGPPKRFKSISMLNLAIARNTRQSWLGFSTTPGPTLYVQAELNPPVLQTRLGSMLPAVALPLPPDTLYFETTRTLRLDDPAGLARLRGMIEAVHPDLVIVDPLARFMSGDENSTRDMGRLVAALDTLVEAYGVAILLVHHTGKPRAEGERAGGERLRGSSALFGAVDSVLLLDRVDAEHLRLTLELRHGAEIEPRTLRRTPTLWLLPSGPPPELLQVAAIVDTLPMRWGLFVQAIEQDLKMSRRSAERALSDTAKAVLVAKNEDNLYATTAIYRQYANGGESNAHA